MGDIMTREMEATIICIDDYKSYILSPGCKSYAIEIHTDPNLGKPSILLLNHPDYISICNKLIVGNNYKIKYNLSDDYNYIIINEVSIYKR